MSKDKILTTKCPQNCGRVGPMSLVLATMIRRGTLEEVPVIECLSCHAYFSLGDLARDPMAFYAWVDRVGS